MEMHSLLIIFAAVALGSYLQALTGFALGIVVLAITVLTDAASIALIATVISVVALPGIGLALMSQWNHIDRASFCKTLAGLVPGTLLGLWLLSHLHREHTLALQSLLGGMIALGGIALCIRPKPRDTRSLSGSFALMGVFGGLLGGMFSIPGPPLIYHYYRQPISVAAIRTTLLALSGAMALSRLVMQGVQGQLTMEVLVLSALCVPVAALATWLYLHFPPRLSDLTMRRGAFALFMLMGAFIAVTAIVSGAASPARSIEAMETPAHPRPVAPAQPRVAQVPALRLYVLNER